MTLLKILAAILQLVAAGVRFSEAQEKTKAGQQEALLGLLKRLTGQINEAVKAGQNFDAVLHGNPDSLLNDDGFKRRSNRIRDQTDGGPVN